MSERWRPAVALLAAALAVGAPAPGRADVASARDAALLAEADRSRGNTDGVVWEVELEATGEDRQARLTLAVQARGFDYLARVLAPPKSRGQQLLMRGGNLWFHKPELSKPVPLSQRQKLLGDAAYGDVAATNYAEDYAIESVADDAVDGEPCRRFELVAHADRATYDRLRYWVATARRVGVRAEYFTRAGRLLKSSRMAFDNSVVEPGGRRRPFISRLVIQDEIVRGRGTILTFSRPALRSVPPRVFDVSLMGR